MTQEEYIKERVEDQIKWFDKKSGINKTYHLWTSGFIIFFAALIPFAAGFNTKETAWMNYVIALLGVLTAIFTGLAALLKFQEKWTTYRITAEALRRETFLFKTETSPYDPGVNSFKLFVSNIEHTLSTENSNWSQMISKMDNESGSKENSI
jgi:hypothetical protein